MSQSSGRIHDQSHVDILKQQWHTGALLYYRGHVSSLRLCGHIEVIFRTSVSFFQAATWERVLHPVSFLCDRVDLPCHIENQEDVGVTAVPFLLEHNVKKTQSIIVGPQEE